MDAIGSQSLRRYIPRKQSKADLPGLSKLPVSRRLGCASVALLYCVALCTLPVLLHTTKLLPGSPIPSDTLHHVTSMGVEALQATQHSITDQHGLHTVLRPRHNWEQPRIQTQHSVGHHESAPAAIEYQWPGYRLPVAAAINFSMTAAHGAAYSIYSTAGTASSQTPPDSTLAAANLLNLAGPHYLPPYMKSASMQMAALQQLQYPPAGPCSRAPGLGHVPSIRIFVAITSRCCTPGCWLLLFPENGMALAQAAEKRSAQRRTWIRAVASLNAMHSTRAMVSYKFFVSGPSSHQEQVLAEELLHQEAHHEDLVMLPGVDEYKSLPAKTLHLLRYSLKGRCTWTHVMKTDDDTFVRLDLLINLLMYGPEGLPFNLLAGSNDKPRSATTTYPRAQPRLSGMYLGRLDRNESGAFPGWAPDRNPRSKWHLKPDELTDCQAQELRGLRWASGWGYLLSRDVALHALVRAEQHAQNPPPWWGRMPWEDVMVAALLRDWRDPSTGAPLQLYHHDGFKAAWHRCSSDTIVKHLDNDAPVLLDGLYAQQQSGLWDKKEVVCTTGNFQLDDQDSWRSWRNSLPDNVVGGFM